MSPLTDATNGIFRWSARPARKFVLLAEGAVEGEESGRLFFSGKSGSLAKGVTAHGEWTFKRQGFLTLASPFARPAEDANCGSLILAASGDGKLSLAWGEEFKFVTGGWLHGHWSFNRGLIEIVRFSRDSSSADVEVVNPTVARDYSPSSCCSVGTRPCWPPTK